MFANGTSLPFAFSSLIVGRSSLPPRCLESCTTIDERPVTSSTCVVIGQAIDEVLELQEAGHFGDDRVGVRIPGRDSLAGGDMRALTDVDLRAVRDLVALALTAEFIDHADFAGT